MHIASLYMRNIERKTHQEKGCNIYVMILGFKYQDFTPPETCKSLSRLIPIPKMYFWNNDVAKDFVNKSARLSHDFVCNISIFLFSVVHEDKIALRQCAFVMFLLI